MKVRNVWIANLIAYGCTWLLLVGISKLAQVFLGVHFSLWTNTFIFVVGAIGDGLSAWMKKQK